MPEAPLHALKDRAEEIRKSVKDIKLKYNGKQLNAISISIGVFAFPTHGNDIETIIELADKALYQAKKNGRDRVFIAEPTEVIQEEKNL